MEKEILNVKRSPAAADLGIIQNNKKMAKNLSFQYSVKFWTLWLS